MSSQTKSYKALVLVLKELSKFTKRGDCLYSSPTSHIDSSTKPSFSAPQRSSTSASNDFNHSAVYRKHQIISFAMSRIESAWKDQTCLLTGGTGMLGTALVVKLLLDTQLHKIYVIVRGGKGEPLPNIVSWRPERTLKPWKRQIHGSSPNTPAS